MDWQQPAALALVVTAVIVWWLLNRRRRGTGGCGDCTRNAVRPPLAEGDRSA